MNTGGGGGGGGLGPGKVATTASLPIEPAEHGTWSGRQPVSANGTELPKVTLSISSAFAFVASGSAAVSQVSLMPWEPMLLPVPNLPSARFVPGSACPLTGTG